MCGKTPRAGNPPFFTPSSGPSSPASPNAAEYLYVVIAIKDLTGVLPALISPLHAGGSVDEDGVERLVEHVIAVASPVCWLSGRPAKRPRWTKTHAGLS